MISIKTKVDETGNRYGKLTVLYRTDDHISSGGHKFAMWHCKCDCGNECNVLGSSLRNGNTKSCGCYQRSPESKNTKKYNTYKDMGDYMIGYCYNGKIFKFDKEDYDLIKDYSWSVGKNGYLRTQHYATLTDILMHRLITNCPDNLVVDHINHDTTDNRKENLRICTQSENMCNFDLRNDNKTGVRGVSWSKDRKSWLAELKLNGKYLLHKRYDNFDDAVKARKEAEELYFGEYSYNKNQQIFVNNNQEN